MKVDKLSMKKATALHNFLIKNTNLFLKLQNCLNNVHACNILIFIAEQEVYFRVEVVAN